MITESQLRVLLDGLARRFENRPQEYGEGTGAFGWGQFLDGQPKHNQVGPFGTCSGIIARALAGRKSDNLDKQVTVLLKLWWTKRRESAEHAKFLGQTIRLAMLNLAIRLKHDDEVADMQREVQSALLAHIRADAMWGNFSMPGEIEDASPRLVASSLVVLSFMLFREADDPPPDILTEVLSKIEDRILGTESLPRLHVAIASAALLSIPTFKPSRQARAKISRLAYATQISLPELGVYFYDYEYEDLEQPGHPSRKFRTDYFIVPTELLLGIAGYQPNSPLYLRFRAEATLRELVKNVQGYDGFYRPDNEQRISSVNQGWVALYLGLAEKALTQGDRLKGGLTLVPRLCYQLVKQRPDRIWLDVIMFGACGAAIVVGSLLPLSGFTLQSVTAKVCTAVLAFLAGRLYAPVFIKRVLVERQ